MPVKNYHYDESGVGVKEFYKKDINGQMETVVVIVYQGKNTPQHFYRPGGEAGCTIMKVPDFFFPKVDRALGLKGRTRASAELHTHSGIAVVREDTWHDKYGTAGTN